MKVFLQSFNIPWSDNLDQVRIAFGVAELIVCNLWQDGNGTIEIYEVMEYLDKVLGELLTAEHAFHNCLQQMRTSKS